MHRVKELDTEVKASGWTKKKNREDRDLEAAVEGMRAIDLDAEEQEISGTDEEGLEEYDLEEDEYEDEDDILASSEEEEVNDAENEKIIEAISAGAKNLKLDKIGNYVLEE